MEIFSLEKSEKYHKHGTPKNDPDGIGITLLGVAIAIVLVLTEILK